MDAGGERERLHAAGEHGVQAVWLTANRPWLAPKPKKTCATAMHGHVHEVFCVQPAWDRFFDLTKARPL